MTIRIAALWFLVATPAAAQSISCLSSDEQSEIRTKAQEIVALCDARPHIKRYAEVSGLASEALRAYHECRDSLGGQLTGCPREAAEYNYLEREAQSAAGRATFCQQAVQAQLKILRSAYRSCP